MRTMLRFTLLLLFALLAVGAFWFGLVPQRLSPLPALTLDERPGWFVDARLATLRYDAPSCQALLKPPHIDATPISDQPIKDGCGWVNAVRFDNAGGAKLSVDKLTCEMAAGVALWLEYEVQPAAEKAFGARVASVEDFGTYDCRNIIGNPMFASRRSQHATANALDVASFTLTDGRTISVVRDWNGNGPEAAFLRDVHDRACRYFRVTLGPAYNKAHRNHFHLDRGLGWLCE